MMRICCFLLITCLSGYIFSQRLNRLNRHGERTGKWIVFLDSAKTKKSTEGRYRNGNPVGKFYYYTMDGVLERREISRFGILKTVLYYPDGTVRFRGKARIENKPDKIHYYFFGKWRYYDERGTLQKYCYYEKGRLVKTVYADKTNKTSDSLMSALNEMDTLFQADNLELLDSISMSGTNVQKRERLQMELYMRDTATFLSLERLLKRFGYPSKELVHEAAVIPFYILSYAPVFLREKYLPLLVAAADKGDLEWKSLAFYIDKIRVAKGEKQVYGTQYYRKGSGYVAFPSEEPEKLEWRRQKVGIQ